MTPPAISPVPPPAAKPQDPGRPAGTDAGSGSEFSNLLATSIENRNDAGSDTGPGEETRPENETSGQSDPALVGQPATAPTVPDAAATVALTERAPTDPLGTASPPDPALFAAIVPSAPPGTDDATALQAGSGPATMGGEAPVRNAGLPSLTVSRNGLADPANEATRAELVDRTAPLSTEGTVDSDQMDAALASFETLLADAGRALGGAGAGEGAGSTQNAMVQQAAHAYAPRQPFGPTPYDGPAATFSPALGTPLTDPAWASEAGGIVRLMVQDNISHAQLRIDPPELGPIEVRMSMEGDAATITFHAASAETRTLLENHLPRLREAMQGAGVELGQATVSQQDRPDSGASSGSRDSRSEADRRAASADAASSPAIVAPSRAGGVRLVDVFA